MSVSAGPVRIVSCNTEFAFGAPERRDGQMRLQRALEPDVLVWQEMNRGRALGGRRFRRWVTGTCMA